MANNINDLLKAVIRKSDSGGFYVPVYVNNVNDVVDNKVAIADGEEPKFLGELIDDDTIKTDGNIIYVPAEKFITEFIKLSDTPDSYEGNGGKILAVKDTEDGLEFVIGGEGGGTTTFKDLTDTPSDYSGASGKVVVVNSSEDGLIFQDISDSGGGVEINQIDVDISDDTSWTKTVFINNNFGYRKYIEVWKKIQQNEYTDIPLDFDGDKFFPDTEFVVSYNSKEQLKTIFSYGLSDGNSDNVYDTTIDLTKWEDVKNLAVNFK